MVTGRDFKLTRPSINLVIRQLILDRNGYLKIWFVVAEDGRPWKLVLQSLGYHIFQNHTPARFRKSLQGVTLIGVGWLSPNQARRLINL